MIRLASDKKLLGRWGEGQAAAYLRSKGWKIVGMNYATRFGEIDVIAENRRYVAFVEVKLRKSDRFAAAREFVTQQKQERLRLAAESWLAANETQKQPRFDVIEVYAPQGMDTVKPVLEHFENAFM